MNIKKREGSLDFTLGEHEAALRQAERDITDLKQKREHDMVALQNALEAFRISNQKYQAEVRKTRNIRRGAFGTVLLLLAIAAWLLKHYPTLAEELLQWAINLTSQTK